MATARAWTIRGVSDRTRDDALEAAHASGLNIGEWIDRALPRAAEEARRPRPAAATREDVAELIGERLGPMEEALGRITERLATLEEQVVQRTEAGPGRVRMHRKNPRGPRLRLPST